MRPASQGTSQVLRWIIEEEKSKHSLSSKPKIGICSKSLLWGIKKFIVILLFPDWSARTYLQLFRLPQGVDGHSHLCPANEKCCWQVSKEFMMSPNKLHLECSLDKELYYHGETISVNVHIQVRSRITTSCGKQNRAANSIRQTSMLSHWKFAASLENKGGACVDMLWHGIEVGSQFKLITSACICGSLHSCLSMHWKKI